MDTKTALLQAAERAVRQRGYDGFSYADLAREVGIRKPSIHHHFPTKADLGKALIDQYCANVFETLDAINKTPRGGDRLAAYLDIYRTSLANGEMVCLCVALAGERDSISEEMVSTLNAFHTRSIAWLTDIFKQATDDKSIAGVQDPRQEAMATLGLVEGAQLISRAARNTEHFDNATQLLRARLL